ncbi:MAG: hypothetical protein ABIP03_10130 [Aquihabitans sp.]
MFGFNAILAHQGGWDEMLLVAAPVVVFVLLLRFANLRATKLVDTASEPTDSGVPNPLDCSVDPQNPRDNAADDDAPPDH